MAKMEGVNINLQQWKESTSISSNALLASNRSKSPTSLEDRTLSGSREHQRQGRDLSFVLGIVDER